MSLAAILALGFFLGMRHATDADHVVAVSAIVTRERTLRAAAPIGLLWGLGHTATIVLVGGAIVLFGLVISPRLGLGMELSVGVMLVLLGALSLRGVALEVARVARPDENASSPPAGHAGAWSRRPLFVGLVHGLAGSAAVALLVLGTLRDPVWALAYLLVFGIGTIGGMMLVTVALAVPVAAAARHFEDLHRVLGLVTGLASVAFGLVLVYEIGIVHGLFTGHPEWTPR
jgi:high-affinity nickel-transport protein